MDLIWEKLLQMIDADQETNIKIFTGGSMTNQNINLDYLVLGYTGTNGKPCGSRDEHYPPDNVFNYNGAGNGNDIVNSICNDGLYIYLTGKSLGSGSNYDDIVTFKLDQSLNPQWSGVPQIYQGNGTYKYDGGNCIATYGTSGNGYVYVGGYTNSSGDNSRTSSFITLQYNSSGNNPISNIKFSNSDKPKSYFLYQNYPNPFNPSTMINYDIMKQSNVNLKLYNILWSGSCCTYK